MKKIIILFMMLSALLMSSCDIVQEDIYDDQTQNNSSSNTNTGTGTTGTGTSGTTTGSSIYNGSTPTGNYWSRNDGMGTAYLSLSGSTAKACSAGKETIGTFNSAKPSMTFVIGKDVLEFPLLFSNGKLYVGAPAQAVSTHNAQTQYVSTTKYTCGTTSGSTTTPVPEKGSVIFWSNIKNTDKRFYGAIKITYTEKGYKRQMSIYNFGPSSPGCGVPSTPSALLDPGTYNWTAEWQFYNAYGQLTNSSRGGTFTITSKGCASVEIK